MPFPFLVMLLLLAMINEIFDFAKYHVIIGIDFL